MEIIVYGLFGQIEVITICHTVKLRMVDPDFDNVSAAKALGLSSSNDFLITSAIPLADEQIWFNAGVK